MLAGPGAISTSLILMHQAQTWVQKVTLCVAIGTVAFARYIILRLSAQGARWLSPLALKLPASSWVKGARFCRDPNLSLNVQKFDPARARTSRDATACAATCCSKPWWLAR